MAAGLGASIATPVLWAGFVGKKVADWGEYVYPKINAPELLKQEIERKLPDKGRGKEVFFSSVTDPY